MDAHAPSFATLTREADEAVARLDACLAKLTAEPILPGSDLEAMITRPAATVAGSVSLLDAVNARKVA